ncbi:hypothetical protein G6F68_016158 [Rhizopus microsporus]|nr:hypothetical protein G6F68_016158 [Rhizopus microsporus]
MVNLISTSRNYQAGVEITGYRHDHLRQQPDQPGRLRRARPERSEQQRHEKEEHAGPGGLPAADDRTAATPGSAEADGQHADGRADGADVDRAGHHRSEQDGEGLPGVDGQRPGAAWCGAGRPPGAGAVGKAGAGEGRQC